VWVIEIGETNKTVGAGLTNSTTTVHFLSPGGRGSLPLLKNLERQARRGGYPNTLPFVPSHQGRGESK